MLDPKVFSTVPSTTPSIEPPKPSQKDHTSKDQTADHTKEVTTDISINSEIEPLGRVKKYLSTIYEEKPLRDLIVELEFIKKGKNSTNTNSESLNHFLESTNLDLNSLDVNSISEMIFSRIDQIELSKNKFLLEADNETNASYTETKLISKEYIGKLSSNLMEIFEDIRIISNGRPSIDDFSSASKSAVEALRRNYPLDIDNGFGSENEQYSTSSDLWWKELNESISKRFSTNYFNVSNKLSKYENNFIYYIPLKNKYLFGAICSLFGLITIPMQIPTAIAMLFFAIIGGAVIYPFVLGVLAKPLLHVKKMFEAELPYIQRVSGISNWSEENFTIKAIINDLFPIFEKERLDNNHTKESLQAVVLEYFLKIEPFFTKVSKRNKEYFELLLSFAEKQVVDSYLIYAKIEDKYENNIVLRFLDNRIFSGFFWMSSLIPISITASLVTPLPFIVDFILMNIAFFVLGYRYMPDFLNGTNVVKKRFFEELPLYQEKLEKLESISILEKE